MLSQNLLCVLLPDAVQHKYIDSKPPLVLIYECMVQLVQLGRYVWGGCHLFCHMAELCVPSTFCSGTAATSGELSMFTVYAVILSPMESWFDLCGMCWT